MYISKIKLHNFKGFKGDHELNFDIGVNFFVGDNNCGKSSVFEAIDFIRTSKAKEDIITKTEINNNVSVEIEFAGTDLDALLEDLRKQDKIELHFMRENLILDVNSNSSDLIRWNMGVLVANSYVLQISDNVTGKDKGKRF